VKRRLKFVIICVLYHWCNAPHYRLPHVSARPQSPVWTYRRSLQFSNHLRSGDMHAPNKVWVKGRAPNISWILSTVWWRFGKSQRTFSAVPTHMMNISDKFVPARQRYRVLVVSRLRFGKSAEKPYFSVLIHTVKSKYHSLLWSVRPNLERPFKSVFYPSSTVLTSTFTATYVWYLKAQTHLQRTSHLLVIPVSTTLQSLQLFSLQLCTTALTRCCQQKCNIAVHSTIDQQL